MDEDRKNVIFVNEKTLVVIKPDGVKRNLIGRIIHYYENEGLRVDAMKMLSVTEELVARHYPEEDEYMVSLGKKSEAAGDKVTNHKEHGRMIVLGLQKYISSGPVVAMIIEGEDAIKRVRKITGHTDPKQAEKGTVRGDFGEDSILTANSQKRPVFNLIHASGNPEEAKKEISLWFPELMK